MHPTPASACQANTCLSSYSGEHCYPFLKTGGVDGGIHITDVTNASRTNLMDVRTLTWHQPTLELFGVSTAMLPEIRSNAEVYGWVGWRVGGCVLNMVH